MHSEQKMNFIITSITCIKSRVLCLVSNAKWQPHQQSLDLALKSEIDVSALGAKRPCPVRCRQFYNSEADTTATSATSLQLENENCA
jgi:hypothetical protein